MIAFAAVDDGGGRQWYTPKEAAEYLRVSIPTLYRLTHRGLLEVFHIGALRRYKREDLDAVPTVRKEGGQDDDTGA